MRKINDFAVTATLQLASRQNAVKPHIRSREPVSRSKGRVVGYYASWKNKRPVAWESQLERDACALFEFSKGVVAYFEQPEKFELKEEGKSVSYTPDFKLSFRCGGVAYVEIKPESYLKDGCLKSKLAKFSEIIRLEKKADFFVLTEREIRVTNFQTNLTILKHYSKLTISNIEVCGMKAWLQEKRKAPIFALSKMLGSSPKAFAFIAHGHAQVDLSQPLSETSMTFTNEDNSDESIIFSCRFAPDFE